MLLVTAIFLGILGINKMISFLKNQNYDFDKVIVFSIAKHQFLKDPRYKTMLISECDNGIKKFIYNYHAFPATVSGFATSIGDKCSDNDIWTSQIDLDTWEKALIDLKIDFVLIENITPSFCDNFGSIFKRGDLCKCGLFRVNKLNRNSVRLTGIED